MSKPRTRLFTMLQVAFTLVMVVALATGGVAFAQAISKPLSTNYTLVNLGSAEAHAQATYYKEDGSNWPASQTSFTLAADGGQAIVRQYEDSMAAGSGSAVISADQPLGSVVQILARNQTPTSGAYVGSSNTAATYNIPLVLKARSSASGVTTSQIIVQNADVSDASVTVTLTTLPGSAGTVGGTLVETFTVKPGASKYYDLGGDGDIPAEWYGSAVVAAADNKQLAVVVNQFSGAHTLQTFNAFQSNRLGSSWFVPLFTSRLANLLSTPVTVQNLSGASMAVGSITLSCVKDAASPDPATITRSNTAAIAANSSQVWNPVTETDPTTGFPAGWYGACRVTAPGNVAVFVQMRQPGANDAAAAYEAVLASGTNKTVLVPLVAKRLPNGFATAVTIQNLSTSTAATVNLTYKPSPEYIAAGGSSANITVGPLTIPAGGSLIRNHRIEGGPGSEPTVPNGWVGTLTVVSTGPALDGFVQLTSISAPNGDQTMAHAVCTKP